MSKIDAYNHELLGFILCESDFDFVFGSNTRKIGIYRLKENIPSKEIDFDGKIDDILIGGGKGEAPAFRISNPKGFKLFSDTNFDDFEQYDELYKSFWSSTDSFKLCNGFIKAKWNPNTKIEIWLSNQICSILSENFEEYSEYKLKDNKIHLTFEVIR